jgi:hypothetical protein
MSFDYTFNADVADKYTALPNVIQSVNTSDMRQTTPNIN